MRSSDEARYNKVKNIEKKIEDGEAYDKKTGRTLKLKEEDEIVDLEEGDYEWVALFRAMLSTIPPDGGMPTLSEAKCLFESGMGVQRILHPENQLYVRDFLESSCFAGRSEGLAEKFEKPKTPKKTGRNRSPPRRNTSRRVRK